MIKLFFIVILGVIFFSLIPNGSGHYLTGETGNWINDWVSIFLMNQGNVPVEVEISFIDITHDSHPHWQGIYTKHVGLIATTRRN